MKYVGDNAPVWTIGHSQRHPLFAHDDGKANIFLTSGGGMPVKKASPKADKILKSREINEKYKFVPTFSKAKRNPLRMTTDTEKVPGPGSYDVGYHDLARNLYSNRKGFIPVNYKQKISYHAAMHATPGVGSYTVNNDTIAYRATQGLGANMGYKTEELPPDINPVGPGQYDVDYEKIEKSTKPESKKIGFSKAERNLKWLLNNHETADVQTIYKIPDSLDELRKPCSIAGNLSKSERVDYIGPGKLKEYEKENSNRSEIKYNWGYEAYKNRKMKEKGPSLGGKSTYLPESSFASVPGPGEYGLLDEFSKGRRAVSMTKGKRNNLHNSNSVDIGPGAYDVIIQKNTNGPILVAPSRRRTKRKEAMPGPGQYDPTVKKSKAHCYSMSLSEREPPRRGLKHLYVAPGPGSYEPSFNQLWKKAPGVMIKSTEKSSRIQPMKSEMSDGPAVGSYFLEDLEKSGSSVGVSFSRAKRMKNNAEISEIGSGKYDLKPTFPQIARYEATKLDGLKSQNTSKYFISNARIHESSQISKVINNKSSQISTFK